MIVRLSIKQRDAIFNWLPKVMQEYVDAQDDYLGVHEEGSMTEWAMVPDAFLFIVNALVPDSIHLDQNAQRGLRRIVREVNAYRTHPGWTGVAMVGKHEEFLVGWRAGDDPILPFFAECQRLRRPEPVVLHPLIHARRRPIITEWRETDQIDPSDLADEVYDFARRVLPDQHPSFQQRS